MYEVILCTHPLLPPCEALGLEHPTGHTPQTWPRERLKRQQACGYVRAPCGRIWSHSLQSVPRHRSAETTACAAPAVGGIPRRTHVCRCAGWLAVDLRSFSHSLGRMLYRVRTLHVRMYGPRPLRGVASPTVHIQ